MASATPASTPETIAMIASGRDAGVLLSRRTASGNEAGWAPYGASRFQKPKTINAPVSELAMKPAVDLRRAKGRGRRAEVKGMGKDCGSGGVR